MQIRYLILVSGNWAHALDPMLPEDQMTQRNLHFAKSVSSNQNKVS